MKAALLLPLFGLAVLPLIGLAACQTARADDIIAQPSALTQDAPWLTIKSLESKVAISAQFNPKDLTIDKPVPWSRQRKSDSDPPALEFTAAKPRTMDFELMFDLFETKGNVHSQYIQALEQMAFIQDDLKRPPMVTVTWGSAMPAFQGVISDLNVKYTMFLPDGTPCRATVNVRMKEASHLLNSGQTHEQSCSSNRDCDPGEICRAGLCADP